VWGAAGLTASAGIAGWVEMLMLRRTLNARIGTTGLPAAYVVKLWLASASGAATGWVARAAVPSANPLVAAMVILTPYGLVFFAVAFALRIPEASRALGHLTGRRR
jgi:putative peptidoglycan lipid II flippase